MRWIDIEFRILLSLRQIKTLLLRTRMHKAQQRLAKKKYAQKKAFLSFSSTFSQDYQMLSKYTFAKFVTPLWEKFNARIEKALLPSPIFSFLNNPTIMLTMFGGSSFDTELAYLKKKYLQRELMKLLEEEYVGDPLLISNKYLTSFNSIRQLYLLSIYFEKIKTQLYDIKTIVEWGGGYGNMAKLFLRMVPNNITYIMIDTPLFCCLQWLYLTTIFGSKNVYLHKNASEKMHPKKINIIPVGLIDSFASGIAADLFISTWGLSESSKYSQDFVDRKNWFGANHIMLGFQKNSLDLPTAEYVGTLAKKRK